MECLSRVVLVLVVVVAASGMVARAAEDIATECTAPLETMISCLSYVQGTAPALGQACCTNLEKVHENHPKCLCALIAQSGSNSTTLAGVPPIDPKLALKLPVACKVAANPNVCPGLLGISASSPEARIFETTSSGSNSTTPSTSTGVTPVAEAPPVSTRMTSSDQSSSSPLAFGPRVSFFAFALFVSCLF